MNIVGTGSTRARRRLFISSLCTTLVICSGHAVGLQVIYVSAKEGNDTWSGSADKPLATLSAARDLIRIIKSADGLPAGGIEVRVREGTYRLTRAVEFGEQDSGTADAPILYRAAEKGSVQLSGGVGLDGFTGVTDPEVRARLNTAVRDRVWQVSLVEHLPELGETVTLGPRLELFFNQQAMTLARWPNEGYTLVEEVPPQDEEDGTGGQFTYLDHRVEGWGEEKEAWLHGFWRYQWSDEHLRIESIDPHKRLITLAPPRHRFGYSKH